MNERKNSIELDYAIEHNLVSIEEIIDVMIDTLHINNFPDIEKYAANHSMENPICIPVNVVRGRKFKGEGYLVYALKYVNKYGFGRYRTEYNYYPIIVNPKTKSFEKVNSFDYLEFSDETKALVKETIRKNIKNTREELLHMAHGFAYKMSYSSCDTRNLNNLINDYSLRGLKVFHVVDKVKEAIKIYKNN